MTAISRSARSWRCASCGLQKLGYSHEIVGQDCEDEDGLPLGKRADFDLRQSSDRLGPAEDFFDPFADDLADRVAGMPGDATVDGRPAGLARLGDVTVDRDMGRHLAFTQRLDELDRRLLSARTARNLSPTSQPLRPFNDLEKFADNFGGKRTLCDRKSSVGDACGNCS